MTLAGGGESVSEDDRNHETDEQRERYNELLGELRTMLPGAQVLFAFLLTVPFASRFGEVDRVGKVVFTVSLMTVATATLLFLAPAAYHRLAPRRDRLGRLRFGVRTALLGLLLLGLSMACAVFVVVRFLFDSSTIGAILAGGVALLALVVWYVLPIRNRRRTGGEPETRSER